MSLMVVQRFSAIGEAEAAAAALYSWGLDVCLVDDEMVGLYWTLSNGLGGVKVMVWWEDLELAGVLLGVIPESGVPPDVLANAAEGAGNEVDAEAESLSETAAVVPPVVDSEADVILCPSCGASRARRIHRLRLFLVIAVLLGGVGLAVGELGLATAAVLAAALIVATVPSHQCPECGERWGADVRRMLEAPEPDTAWPPTEADLAGELCPRCGSDEYHVVYHRRLKAFLLLIPLLVPVVLLPWPFLANRQCDACGLKT